MIYIGIDPSLKRTAVSWYDDVKNEFHLDSFPEELEQKKGYEEVYSDANKISDKVSKYITDIGDSLTVISEIPPPQGQYSPGLYAYDSLLIHKLQEQGHVKQFYRVYPNYLGHIHGKRKYAKSESVVLAKSLMTALETKVRSKIIIERGRLNHDESESFLFLCRLLVLKGKHVDILSQVEGLTHDKEKLMWEV